MRLINFANIRQLFGKYCKKKINEWKKNKLTILMVALKFNGGSNWNKIDFFTAAD